MEKKLAELTGKLKTLSFTLGKTEDVIAKENREVTERQGTSITTMIRAVKMTRSQPGAKKLKTASLRRTSKFKC